MNAPAFLCFHADGSDPPDSGTFVACIPTAIEQKQDLFRVLSTALKFPSYFGFNWAALDECLADLSWLDTGEVVLWHEGTPLSRQPIELRRYLEILQGIKKEQKERRITISFPESCKSVILNALT